MWDTLTSGEAWRGEIINKAKDGTLFTEEATISPVFDNKGKIINYIGVKHDVTKQRVLEDQLRQAQKMETVGRLAGGVAHDFNNMLNVILGSAELVMTRDDLDDSILKNLQQIQKAAERSADITRQLLAFSRKQVIEPRVVKLNPLIKDIEKMLGRLLGEDIDILSVPEKEIWNIMADPGQIHQIVANLCINARDAMPQGGKLTIETANVTFDDNYCKGHAGFVPGRFVMLAISDNGIGMDKEILAHIFEPFFTTKEEGKGTGLGLASVYGAVKHNNGFINVYSEPGQGTTFKLYFPQCAGKAEKPKATVKAPKAFKTVAILLVEDDEMVRNLTMMMLEKIGHTVVVAETPEEALALFEKVGMDIDLLLSDVVMPQMNGKSLKKSIEALKPGIKTLLMSGYTANVIAHHGVLEKGMHFIQKPFSIEDLARKVREAIEQ
jgi:signal transduction histidine kinase/CheY-like chemotaxis protein